MKECKGLDELGRCRLVMMMDSNITHYFNTSCLKEGCEFYDQLTKKEDTMTDKKEKTEQYLKYPLRLRWKDFIVCITQIVTTFKTELSKGDDLIKAASHSTIHLAVLWANNELDYLERLNKDR